MNMNVRLKKKYTEYKESFLREGKTSEIILILLNRKRNIITKFDKPKV